MIYLLDADLNGTDSIQDVIDAGLVRHVPLLSYPDYENCAKRLLEIVTPDDVVVVDTINELATKTRGDMKLGIDPTDTIWDKRTLYFGDKNALNLYQAAQDAILRPLRNLRHRGARIITTSHERMQNDDETLSKLRAPALNAKFYEALDRACSDMFRLFELTDDYTDGANVTYKKGTRVLQLRKTDSADAKYHVTREMSDKVPSVLFDPTLPRLYETLGKKPSWLCIYGHPGCGKTTLSVGDAYTLLKAA